MNKLELVVDNTEEVIPTKPGMKPPKNGDWLSGMKVGTEFLCRDKSGAQFPRYAALDFTFLGLHNTGNVLLSPTQSINDTRTWKWFIPEDFCKAFEFRGIIEEPEG